MNCHGEEWSRSFDCDGDNDYPLTHARRRGYRLPLPESQLRNRVGTRLRSLRLARGRR